MCQCERACIIKVNYTETSHSVSQELMERVYIYISSGSSTEENVSEFMTYSQHQGYD